MSFELMTDKETTARKTHKCVWCGERIEKGQKYRQQSGFFEYEPIRTRYHPECYAAMIQLHKIDSYAVEDGFQEASFKRGTIEER